jgi:hypothetical protein
MKKIYFLLVCILVSSAVFANTSLISVEVKAQVEHSNDQIVVRGITNLPEKTNLSVSYTNVSTLEWSNFIIAEVMKDGHFTTDPFGKNIKIGKYNVSIITPLNQPKNVQAIIGDGGVNLSGPFVKDDLFGKSVSYMFPFSLGSKKDIEDAELQNRKLVKFVNDSTEELLNSGFEMDKIRGTVSCQKVMWDNLDKLDVLQKKADQLPRSYIRLKALTLRLRSCLTCKASAKASCDMATQELQESIKFRQNNSL